MKIAALALAVTLTGCTTLDQIVCYGNGTCGNIPNATYQTPTPTYSSLNPTTATTVITNRSTLLIVPNYAGGAFPSAIISSGK
jgi:hypothetical protein